MNPREYTTVELIEWYSNTFPSIPNKETYINFIREQSIDGDILSTIDDCNDLSDGIDNKLHRKNIITKWKTHVKSFDESASEVTSHNLVVTTTPNPISFEPQPTVNVPTSELSNMTNDSKLFLLVKPCQSGKTGEAFNHLNQLIENFNTGGSQRHIAITFVDNNLILTVQTSIRSQKTLNGCDSIDFTSKSEHHKSRDNVQCEISNNQLLM